MNRISALLVGAALAAATTSTMAADAVFPQPAATYDWTGFYLGAHGGYVSTRTHDSGFFGFNQTFDGGLLGVHAGYNFIQHGNWVLGIEGDVGRAWNDRSYAGGFVVIGSDWQWSARARVGYALDRTLIYGTAGVAGTHGYVKIPIGSLKFDDTMIGWTAGVGVEHAFTDNWLVRAEYRYSGYGEFEFIGLPTGIDVDEHAFRLGVSYKF